MLHTKAVQAQTLVLIKQIMLDPRLEDFYLVGDAALSLLMGHQRSLDIELCSRWEFDPEIIGQYLKRKHGAAEVVINEDGMVCFIQDIRVDIFADTSKRMAVQLKDDGIRMESMKDIGAMKLNGLLRKGFRIQDLVNIYFLLEYEPLDAFMSAVKKKYPPIEMDSFYRRLRYSRDLVQAILPFVGEPITHLEFNQRLVDATRYPQKVFARTPPLKPNGG